MMSVYKVGITADEKTAILAIRKKINVNTVSRNGRRILVPRFLTTVRDMDRKLTFLFGTSGTCGVLHAK
jgi:hypothetical protein